MGWTLKWDEAGKGFLALGTDGAGSPVGFRTDSQTGHFQPILLDRLDAQANSISDVAIHGDDRGNRGAFITYEVPSGTGAVKLRRSALVDGSMPTGAFTDTFANADKWITSTEGTETSSWKSDSDALAFDPPARARGEAVGKAWLGDGLYQLKMRGEHNDVGDSLIRESGLQIGRQDVAGNYGDSGYTVLFKGNRISVTKGGPEPFTNPSAIDFVGFNGWPFITDGKDPGNFTLNVLKKGPYPLLSGPARPGNPNTAHANGGTHHRPRARPGAAGHPGPRREPRRAPAFA